MMIKKRRCKIMGTFQSKKFLKISHCYVEEVSLKDSPLI